MARDLAALTRRTLDKLATLSSVTTNWDRVMPEEAEAIQRVAVLVAEMNWDARRLT